MASQYQEELPVVRPVVRRFDIEVGHCSQCQRRVQGRHVLQTSDALGAAGVQLGPAVVALVVELHTEMGVPLAKVAHLLRTTFGLQVTPGGLAHVLHRAARAAAPAYTELCEQVRKWAFVTPDTTVYAICPGRGFDDAATVLGTDYVGVLVRDGWAPYRCYDGLHQTWSESPAPTLQAAPGGSSRQSLGRRGAGGPAGRPRPARRSDESVQAHCRRRPARPTLRSVTSRSAISQPSSR